MDIFVVLMLFLMPCLSSLGWRELVMVMDPIAWSCFLEFRRDLFHPLLDSSSSRSTFTVGASPRCSDGVPSFLLRSPSDFQTFTKAWHHQFRLALFIFLALRSFGAVYSIWLKKPWRGDNPTFRMSVIGTGMNRPRMSQGAPNVINHATE